MKLLTRNSSLYVAVCTLLGAVVLLLNATQLRSRNPWVFLIDVVSAVAVSVLNLRLTIGRAVLSAGLLVVPLSIIDLCRQTQIPAAVLALPMLLLIERGYRFYRHARKKEEQHQEELEAAHMRTIEALAVAIEARDQTTHTHLRRVQVCAIEVGREMGLDAGELKALKAAALLHDVGKLAIPEHIVSKPGRLTPEEFEKMKIHPIVGSEILERMQLPYAVAPIVRAHHEKWDGTGYPEGLAGEQIPLNARILSAVDCLDALASDRPYRRAMQLDQAMNEIAAEAGKSFDPRVIEILKRRYTELDGLAHEQVPMEDRSWISTGIRVPRGAAPATGLQNLALAVREGGAPPRDHFLDSIASASHENQFLRELTMELGSTLNLDQALSVVAGCAARIASYDTMVVSVCRDRKLAPVYISGLNSALFSAKEFDLGQGLSGWVAENQKPIVNGDPAVELSYIDGTSAGHVLKSALSVPLEGPQGLVGVLSLYSPACDAFTREHLRILQTASMKIGSTIENALRYQTAANSATAAHGMYEKKIARC